MDVEAIRLRGGAVEVGRVYEQRMAALLATRLVLSKDVEDFWMVSNISGVGAFDDIVTLVDNKDGTKTMYCLQLKHIEKGTLQIGLLEGFNKDFSLRKYQESYEDIKRDFSKLDIFKNVKIERISLILYTNAQLLGTGQTISKRSVEGSELLNTSNKSNKIFHLINDADKAEPLDKEFLSQFYLYTEQSNTSQIDNIIRNEVYSHFQDVGNAVIINLTDFFAKWTFGRKGKIMKINKKYVQSKLIEYVLSPYIIEPSIKVQRADDLVRLLSETLLHFNITNISQERYIHSVLYMTEKSIENVCDIHITADSWNTNLTPEQLGIIFASTDNDKKQLIQQALKDRQHYLPHLTFLDLYWSAWHCKIIPLSLNCTKTVQQSLTTFLDITKDLSFVILGTNFDCHFEYLSVFRNLTNIRLPSLLDSNLNKLSLSLQGKAIITVKEFVNNINILNKITPDVYVSLIEESLTIGEPYEIEKYYIKRNVILPRLDINLLDQRNVLKIENGTQQNQYGDWFILVEIESVPNRFVNNSSPLKDFVNKLSYISENQTIYILYIEQTFNNKLIEIANVLSELCQKSVHILKMIDHKYLEWNYSKGSISTLKAYLVEPSQSIGDCISEDSMLNYLESNVNILSNNGGMGKSFFLQSIANKYDANIWVFYVNLSDIQSELSKFNDTSNFLDYTFCHQMKDIDEIFANFCGAILMHCIKMKKIIWLLDGYDEVASQEAVEFLNALNKSNLGKIWITTRPTYKNDLEDIFDSLSMEMTHFTETDHIDFLEKYLGVKKHIFNIKPNEIKSLVITVDKCSKTLDRTFVGIPLQTKMLAEVFGNNKLTTVQWENISIIELYDKFIDMKLEEYKSYEATSLKRTVSKLALKLFYAEELLQPLIDFEELSEDMTAFQESYKKDTIVTGIKENGDAYFSHRSYAEFLAAQWISKKIIKKTSDEPYNYNWVPIAKKLFYKELQPVRLFFDRIIASGLDLHTAVLNDDFDKVMLLISNQKLETVCDKLGRSPLHLAASHGYFYDLYLSENLTGIRNVGTHSKIHEANSISYVRIPRMEKQQVSLEVVDKLVQHNFSNNKDGIFNYDIFDYAMKSCSLKVLDRFYSKFEKNDMVLDEEMNLKLFIYCVAFANLHNVLSPHEKIDFENVENVKHTSYDVRDLFMNNISLLKTKYEEIYLTELAASQGSREVILILINSGILKVTDGYPVHRACLNGHFNTLELLYNLGARVDIGDENAVSPLQQSGRQQRSDVTYNLLKTYHTNLSSRKAYSFPIHYACQGGHLGSVKTLIRLGARVNIKDSYGFTPLFHAAMYGYYEVIQVLLSTGEYKGTTILPALNVAASLNYVESVKQIIKYNASVINETDQLGYTPLMLACKEGSINTVKLLTSFKECNLDLLNTKETHDSVLLWAQGNNYICLSVKLVPLGLLRTNQGGVAAIHYAVRHGQIACIKILIQQGANTNIQDGLAGIGYSPLVWSSLYGKPEITSLLMKCNADIDDIEIALVWACILGYNECVNSILSYKTILDQLKLRSGQWSEEMIRILKAEFSMNFMLITKSDNIPILLAAKNGHFQVIEALVSGGFQYNKDLNTALHWAAREGHVECVKGLIKLGADENSTDNIKGVGYIPITWASMYGKSNVVKLLLKNKTQEYLKNKKLHQALNGAATAGHLECLKILLEFGLDINNKDAYGNTPLICACEFSGTKEVITELITSGCDIYRKNNDGDTALDMVVKRKSFHILGSLIKHYSADQLNLKTESPLYSNFQLALDWAEQNNDNELSCKLLEIGICKNSSQ